MALVILKGLQVGNDRTRNRGVVVAETNSNDTATKTVTILPMVLDMAVQSRSLGARCKKKATNLRRDSP